MRKTTLTEIDFKKGDGLVPVIIQDHISHKVLMLGYMNETAFEKTEKERRVTFFSRSKERLWTKGENSGNFLEVKSMSMDCDKDTLLIKVAPQGPVCHLGTATCFEERNESDHFLFHLESVIKDRFERPDENSYTSSLFKKGINKVAQKVGEEAVELVIEAKDDNKVLFLNEAADLMYHYLVLLRAKGYELHEVNKILKARHQ